MQYSTVKKYSSAQFSSVLLSTVPYGTVVSLTFRYRLWKEQGWIHGYASRVHATVIKKRLANVLSRAKQKLYEYEINETEQNKKSLQNDIDRLTNIASYRVAYICDRIGFLPFWAGLLTEKPHINKRKKNYIWTDGLTDRQTKSFTEWRARD